MRKILVAAAILALMPNAHAQDKAKGDISFGGEFRARDSWMMNSAGVKDSDKNTAYGRMKMDVMGKAGDKLSANMTLIHNTGFGSNPSNEHNGTTGNSQDYLTVNQAFGSWMASDDLTIKVGRMNYQIGDGTIMGINDWENVPYSYEGLLANWEAEFGRFQLIGFKFEDGTTAPAGGGSDPENNLYGLNFDLKTMPEVLKAVNVHVLQNNANSTTAAAGTSQMRYGVNANLAFGIIDLGLWYEAQSGKDIAAGGAKTNHDGSLMAASVGANFANFMNSKLWVKYHQDTGDKSSTTTKNEAYTGFFTEKHASAGHMDLFGFGNLTFIQVGWTGKPMDSTEVGLNYWMLSKTEKTGAATLGLNGSAFTPEAANKSKLGDEIDLWAAHKYDNGLTTTLRLGMFMPGDVFKDAATKRDKAVTEVFLEGRYSF